MIIYRTLYISGWDTEDHAMVMFYDEENSKIWKERIPIEEYIGLHCLYNKIELQPTSKYP